MADWLRGHNLTSERLRWYINYGCRDDYGASIEDVSAWAGLHYYACREDVEANLFTWPEGNGWVVKQLLKRFGQNVQVSKPVYRIAKNGKLMNVFTEDTLYETDVVIYSAPTFIAPYIVDGMEALDPSGWVYSPWLTANITLEEPPENTAGMPLAWDNVIYNSPTLGYVVANHQSGPRKDGKMVVTYYWALSDYEPGQGRLALLDETKGWSYWKDAILRDMEVAHPNIRDIVSRVDLMRMGHAMVRPVPGSIFHPQRRQLATQKGQLLFANNDLSGFAIFEEAQFRGVIAAERAADFLSGKVT